MRIRTVLFGCAIALVPVSVSGQVNYALSPITAFNHPDGTRHYYRLATITYDVHQAQNWGWPDAAAFADAQRESDCVDAEGVPVHGYLGTITSQAEAQTLFDSNHTRNSGYVGAVFNPQLGWIWATGPEAGTPVTPYGSGGPIISGLVAECGSQYPRLIWSWNWYSAVDVGYVQPGFGMRCAPERFLVEFSPCPGPTPAQSSTWGAIKQVYR